MRYTSEILVQLKCYFMKQTTTLKNDLTMIINVLSDMVDNNDLSEKQLEKILEGLFENYAASPAINEKPGKNVVRNIMNYSKALDVIPQPGKGPLTMIIN